MKISITIVTICLLVTACKSTPEHFGRGEKVELPVINLEDNWNSQPLQVNLSTLADSIFYIPLETGKDCIVSDKYSTAIKVDLLTNYLVVYDHDRNPIRVFGLDGKFLTSIGGYGKGPGEYMNGENFVCDESKDRIYIAAGNQKKIICYNFKGKLINEISLSRIPCEITIDSDHNIVVLFLSFGGSDIATLQWFSSTGELIKTVPFYKNRLPAPTATWGSTDLYWSGGEMSVNEPPFDTIWRYNTQLNTFEGVYSFKKGPKGVPREVWFSSRWSRESSDYHIVATVIDCVNAIFIDCNGLNFREFIYYKHTGDLFTVKFEENQERWFQGVHNDLDGGMPFWPATRTGDYLITCVGYDDVQSYFKDNYHKNVTSEVNVSMHRRFTRVIQKFGEYDNPIVVVARIKK